MRPPGTWKKIVTTCLKLNISLMLPLQVTTMNKQQHKWWQYVTLATNKCGDFRVLPVAEECAHAPFRHKLLHAVGIDPDAVIACERKSGGTHIDQ